MGREISQIHYNLEQELNFRKLLEKETQLLKNWIKEGAFGKVSLRCGYEVEGQIIDDRGYPYACSVEMLKKIKGPHITPELSKFNFEINGDPYDVNEDLPENISNNLASLWKTCVEAASQCNGKALCIGTHPNLAMVELGENEIYPLKRYYALNNRIQKMRREPAHIYIDGHERLSLDAPNLIFEAQATSLQIHLQVPFAKAKDFYNASLIISPLMSALCANSPYVFGKELWHESRIPVFEQAISLKTMLKGHQTSRVGLGADYVRNCISELFDLNLEWPILLPDIKGKATGKLEHLCFHNGTIWRWNRPIIGIDKQGMPHFRIEHRVPSSGPTLVDIQANIIFFIGLCHFVARYLEDHEIKISFEELENSFYQASRNGPSTEVKWIDGKAYSISELVAQKLCPLVKDELRQLSLDSSQVDYLIEGIIGERSKTMRNGSNWQKSFVLKYGKNFGPLMQRYWQLQSEGMPVHQWSL